MSAMIGQKEPAWKALAYVNGEQKQISSDDYKGKWHVLYWYPLDFTFVCPTEIKGFQALIDDFKDDKTEVIGVSTDSFFSHKAWLRGPRHDSQAEHAPRDRGYQPRSQPRFRRPQGRSGYRIPCHGDRRRQGRHPLDQRQRAGNANIVIRNITGGSLSEALTLRFIVLKSVNA